MKLETCFENESIVCHCTALEHSLLERKAFFNFKNYANCRLHLVFSVVYFTILFFLFAFACEFHGFFFHTRGLKKQRGK